MAYASDPAFLLLHCVRLKGFASNEAIASAAGLAVEDTEPVLSELASDGLVTLREGRISGWSLTPAGRERHATLVAEELAAAACADGVRNAYERFLAINHDLLAACTDWQMRTDDTGKSAVPNDHSDSHYDAQVIDRLFDIDRAVQPVCSDLAHVMERFAHYGPRLADAAEKVKAGDTDWFTRPMIDSYHTVWFELHEDLLCTLGIERHREGEG